MRIERHPGVCEIRRYTVDDDMEPRTPRMPPGPRGPLYWPGVAIILGVMAFWLWVLWRIAH